MRSFLVLLLLFTAVTYSQITYFGPTGYNFVPNGYSDTDSSFGAMVANKHTSLNKTNLIFDYITLFGVINLMDKPLEISLSNTPGFVSDNGFEKQRYSIPFIPALKYHWLQSGHTLQWSVSSGFVYNYGIYTVTTFRTESIPFIIPEASLGLSYALNKAYIMGGAQITLADANSNPIPFTLLVEAASGGSTKYLGTVDEGFVSYGFSSQITDHISIAGNYRVDPSVYYSINEDNPDERTKKPNQNSDGLFSFSLIFKHKNL